ncbi:MAG: glycosyltransferase family 2 protein [Deltaproteobacteria bacterium]|nr:glycosyltransferase family 2 protein [Deltaproteobacteria bacterium]
MAPTVSVVIPSYNRAHCIEKAIDSVLEQSYREEVEVILVDDGSTDNTRDVVGKYDERVRYFYQENQGIPGARNTGISNAAGKYVAFLDSDDYWRPEKLARQMQLFDEHPEYGLVGSCCASVRLDGSFKEKNREGKSGWVLNDLFRANFIRTSAAVIRRDCFDAVGLFDVGQKQAQEYDLWLRMAAQFQVGFINESLTVYVDNPKGVSVDSLLGRLYRLRLLEKEYLYQKVPAPLYRKRMAQNYCVVGRHYLRRGDREKGLVYVQKAVKLNPCNMKNIFYFCKGLCTSHKKSIEYTL